MSHNKQSVLKQYFGYDTFKEGQEQLIDHILSGHHVVGVMPTGAGKSICYQVPAMLFEGITLVISPLISLMKDQVNALTQLGIRAAYINSALTERQTFIALENARKGIYKIIYVAPERLETAGFIQFARSADIAMVTVDEAHCISQWGQDFRPSYLKIAPFIESLSNPPVVSAFTATATPKVREDIVNSLRLPDPVVLVTGFDRKNLYFQVEKPKDKFAFLTAYLSDKKDKYGIVYCATRNTVEEVCDKLKQKGYSATRYHAGLAVEERQNNQDDFLFDREQIMVATNAFGMGIDKSNVSFVVHYNMPKNIESYYQEAGRAGRDGENAECLLLYSGQDVRTNMYFIENNKDVEYPDAETEAMLKERDRQRLKEMTFYCHTQDCLRAYILKYFAEITANYCGHCGNCDTQYESVDVTIETQKILSCVYKARERYGVKMIIDVLRGSKSEKVLRLGLDKLSTYNISELSEKRLRDIINHLVLHDYLFITNNEYPVLQLHKRANEVLRLGEKVIMKLPIEIAPQAKTKAKTQRETRAAARAVNQELLAKLKALRLQLAESQNVPAYVVFADSALIEMCIKLPQTQAELLQISGVGQVKLERYGERFLHAIADFLLNNANPDEPEDPQEHKDSQELDFSQIEISDEAVMISIIADKINCCLMQNGGSKITGAKLNDWLLHKEYLKTEIMPNGKRFKIPTDAGAKIGIAAEERVIRGENCYINSYGRKAQELLVGNLTDILQFLDR